MARFATCLMGDGAVDGHVLVDGALLRGMAVPTTTDGACAGLQAGHALGLARRDRHGVVGRCHLGNIGVFGSAICLYPDHQRAFFVAFNSDPEDGRFEQFAHLDELMGVTPCAGTAKRCTSSRSPGPRELSPVGGALFRAPDRRGATHVLLRTGGDVPVVSDEIRTLERVSPSSVWGLRASAAAGFLGLVYLLVVGATRGVLVLVIAGMQRVRAGVGPMGARLDFAASLGMLQWCGVLAAWGLVPLVMWR